MNVQCQLCCCSIFVAKQLSEMIPAIVRLLLPNQRTLLEDFNSKNLEIVCEMRAEICQIPCFDAFDFAAIEKAIANVNWEIGELMSQHSAYVDDIVLALVRFNRRLADVHLKQKIPKEFHTVLWQLCAKFLFDCLIESYSNVKKSSGEGRALMQLDFQQLLLCIERLCGASYRAVDYEQQKCKHKSCEKFLISTMKKQCVCSFLLVIVDQCIECIQAYQQKDAAAFD
ncbi:coiled-coil domain-containing protein 132 [Trichinella spiralis]|uniref:coiled-coil domain-containing protein 132 n=1 Tax=Trichinella spiralis TaxID=6334 RepID=UPI0001EFCF4E|nr:coiled-coil domain-containing protein 132 [Trichinella spiralis]